MLAVVYIFVSKPMYQAKATLEIGYQIVKPKTGKVSVKYFDDAERIKHYIDVKYDTSGKYRKKGAKAFLKEVDVPRKTKQFVSFVAYGLNNNLAESKLKEALNDILSQHKLYLNSAIEKTKESIDSKKRSIQYDSKVLLPQLENKLNILKTVNLKKIDTQINLIKTIDLKKIDTQINLIKEGNLKKIEEKIKFLKSITIPALKEKIAKSSLEIKKKLNAIKNIQKGVNSIERAHPALAAIDTMQAANLQNDIDRLNMRIIDLQLQIKQINKQTIPDLEKQKQRILEQTISDLEKQKQRILEQTIPDLEAQKEKLLKETIPSVAGSIKRLVEITIPTLKTEISLLEMSINPPYLVGTHIVGRIYTHDYPVKPKKKLIVVVAIITGIIFGIFLAFFLEFIGKEED